MKSTTVHLNPELHRKIKEDAKKKRMLLAGRTEELILKGFQYEKILDQPTHAMNR